MTLITRQQQLTDFMDRANTHPFLTVDTEFLREKTYYPKLCLIQIGTPDGEAVAIDPLSNDIDLTPVLDMLRNPDILKIFHAARQDLEIFFKLMGEVPAPLFDTQIAAMVCGYGDQIGYESLVRELTKGQIDKTSQFTDWSNRPLSDKQIDYALGDVTHLVQIYLKLSAELEERGRTHWLLAEEEILSSADTYTNDPQNSWKRIKIKSHKPDVLVVLKELAAWREEKAQRKDIPRTWILRDETLADIAAHPPKNTDQFTKIRGYSKDKNKTDTSYKLLKLIDKAKASDPETWPKKEKKKPLSPSVAARVEILKTLLRISAAKYEVAAKLIAASDDLESIAQNKPADTIRALNGWRNDIFGRFALDLIDGKLALGFKDNQTTLFEIEPTTPTKSV